jgi:adenine-specific DNA-methyltransferase
MSNFVEQQHSFCDFSNSDSWVILSPIEQSIKRKIEAVGTPLRDWDIQINYGIKTGYNDAFIINTAKRDEILSNCQTEDERKRTDDLIRPILRGKDIKKYGYEWAELYLIATFPSKKYDIEDYPSVKKYLLSFARERLIKAGCKWIADDYLTDYCKQKLSQTGEFIIINGQQISIDGLPEKSRKKTSNKWFETQDSINYWEDFDKPKIVWARLMRLSKSDVDSFPRFAKAKAGTFVVDSLCFFSGKDSDLLCHLLNSTYAAYYFFRNIAILDNGGMQMRQQYVENIPLPLCLKGMTVCNDKDIYKCFNFSNSEIDFINWFVKKRKEEILS